MQDISIMHFVHWSRSGITELLRTINGSDAKLKKDSIIILGSELEPGSYYQSFNEVFLLSSQHGFFKKISELVNILKRSSLRIIHTHSLVPLILVVFFGPKKQIVHSVHSNYPYLYRKNPKSVIKRVFFKLCVRIRDVRLIAVSGKTKRLLEDAGFRDVFLVYNCIDVNKQSTPGSRYRADDSKAPYRIASFCRLESEKNLENAIKAVGLAIDSGAQVEYHIFGSGSEEPKLKELIDELDLTSAIYFKGYCGNVIEEMMHYDFFLSASTSEAFGLSVLEACVAGIPILATHVGEVSQELKGYNGAFISKGSSAEDLKRLILEGVQTDPEELRLICRNAMHIAKEKFSIEGYFQRINEVYGACRAT